MTHEHETAARVSLSFVGLGIAIRVRDREREEARVSEARERVIFGLIRAFNFGNNIIGNNYK